MDDLIEDDWGDNGDPGRNTPEYSVSEISGAVKKTLEGAFGRVRVRGEVGRVFVARSGHVYFDIKDERAVLASVCWKGQVARLTQRPEEGMEVIATGRLTTFGSQSKYQMTVDDVEPAGEGALMAMLEKRKRQLAAEGLFDEGRKKPLPFLPEVIGVVTSPGGAVIRDILHRLSERFPRRVLVWPVAVQGKDSAPQVARAIAGFNALSHLGPIPRPDLLIVARGGGSIEDLWGFNEEIVARAAAASKIPLISAVGHETDTTLIDFVSDRRAPTPTAAAEIAVPVRLDLLAHVEGLGARGAGAVSRVLERRRERLRDLGRALPMANQLLEGPRQRFDIAALRLPAALGRGVQERRVKLAKAEAGLRPAALRTQVAASRDRLAARATRLNPAVLTRVVTDGRRDLARLQERMEAATRRMLPDRQDRLAAQTRLLESLSYRGTLARGYAVIRDEGGAVLTGLAQATRARTLEIEFTDGRLTTGAAGPQPSGDQADTVKREPPAVSKPGGTARKKRLPPTDPPDQGTLF